MKTLGNLLVSVVSGGVGYLVAEQLPLPLGVENFFSVFIAPLAAFSGTGAAALSIKNFEQMSVVRRATLLFLLGSISILSGMIYAFMYFSIGNPGFFWLVMEGALFFIAYFFFFYTARFGLDRPLSLSEQKSD